MNEYLLDLQAGLEELKKAAHLMFDEQHEIFLLKKRIVNSLISKVTIDKDRNRKEEIRIDLFDLGNGGPDHNDPTEPVVQVSKVGIYT